MVKFWKNRAYSTPIPDLGLVNGLLPLMSDEDVIRFLEYVPRFREVEVYTETGVSLVERHMMERMKSKGKSVVIIVDHHVNNVVGKEFDAESENGGKLSLLEWNQSSQAGNDGTVVDNDFCVFDSDNEFPPSWYAERMIANSKKRLNDEFEFRKLLEEIDHVFRLDNSSQDLEFPNEGMEELLYYDIDYGASINRKEGDLETWFSDEEPEEISDMFADLDQALDELDQVIEAHDVTDLFAIYDQPIDDERDVVPVEVVAEEMVAEEAFDCNDGKQVVSDEDVIPDEVYDAMVAQEGLFLADDRDVIPYVVYDAIGFFAVGDEDVISNKVYDVMVAQEGVFSADDMDVILDEVVAEEMLEDQTRSIKRRRVMVDKEDEDGCSMTAFMFPCIN
ncbi:hypothetical protein Tco_1018413 [Tanacetum coccineum]|uniref:Uncharacterized protein n=1 Tax=Tanacetum coccineum TaxID=301880 RepID=A0ABQ5FVM2_9ASTR